MGKKYSAQQALDRSQWLCSRREMCIADIKTKLFQWGIGPEEQQGIINSLIKDNFIDEERYATAFVREKARFNGWGPRKIEIALRAKSIPQHIIAATLPQAEPYISHDNIEALLAKKAKTIKYKDLYDLKTKLLRFALSRGFYYDDALPLVEKVVKGFEEESKSH